LPVNLICCLINFLLARPFSFFGHFFHLFILSCNLQLIWLMFYFDSEWFKFFPAVDILPVKLIVALLPVNFLFARPFSFFDPFFSFIRFNL
jgi:hypothetical protein